MSVVKNKTEKDKESPEEVPDIAITDPKTKKEIVIEGEHFTINKGLKKKGEKPFVDSDGNELSDRIISRLFEDCGPMPERYNNKEKEGEMKVTEVKEDGLCCETQWYVDKKTGKKDYIKRSFLMKNKPAVDKIREIASQRKKQNT